MLAPLQGSPYDHLAYAVFEDCDPETTLMAMFTGYFDAAGDSACGDVVTVGGFAATVREWSKFHYSWLDILNEKKIDVFHMTDFLASERDFSDWKDADKPEVLSRFANQIVGRLQWAPSSSILLADWESVNKEYYLAECHATPYALGGLVCIRRTLEVAFSILPNAMERGVDVEFVFEKGDRGQGDLQKLLDYVDEAHDKLVRKRTRPIEPIFKSKSREMTALQAADFAAWEQRYAVVNRPPLDQVRDSLKPLLVKFHRQWGIVHRDKIEAMAIEIGVPKRSGYWGQKERSKWRPTIHWPASVLASVSKRAGDV